ncbi:hypothetical protein E2C01_008784 [Portunus trituberculatus]|uniref:Uncharacterized protein n=1 Tax=Portunus trituberculatus TaxID=210409 RepID=A0A5B7D2V7_PORTR|nr:hypothetical protein [Portunus trituberculatus]
MQVQSPTRPLPVLPGETAHTITTVPITTELVEKTLSPPDLTACVSSPQGSSLDPQGILTLYKAQIRPCMEYGALTWMSSAPTDTRRLDTVQRHALHLLGEDEITASTMSLEHRRDVATLTVCHKAWVQHTPHLTRLSLQPHPPGRMTRQAGASGDASLPFLTTPVEPLHGGHA